ncbi:LysM peptidoglycan-binding domain-containing protein [Terrabacter sp. MAHUQ-38]|uniref:LysM peptidoglycan-binding domain-containing protein n=1 Tax=unclassified Terrabacter TaxID=2630222 RepID=UPI001CAA7588|nr:LysM peptidoglycan-binding domain-containing protein [Terrabacter sp. MAHUQ-38]
MESSSRPPARSGGTSSSPALPPPPTRARVLAGELVGGLVGLGVAALALALLGTVARRAPVVAARPDDMVLALLAWAGVGLAAWLAVGSLLAVLALLPGAAGRVAGQVRDRITPLAVRRCLTLVLGASVGSVALPSAPVSTAGSGPIARGPAGVAAPAHLGRSAAPLTDPGVSPAFVPSQAALGPSGSLAAGSVSPGFMPTPRRPGPPEPLSGSTVGRSPERIAGPGYVPSAPAPVLDAERSRLLAPAPRASAATHDLVTVRRGDSLWALAARHLGAGASDAQVAREWPRWYAANRSVIGDDPDLLVPGQQLRPPDRAGATAPTTHPPTDSPLRRGARR